MTDTAILVLPEIAESQGSKYLTHNEALTQLEGMLVRVKSATTTAQPGSPAPGDTYIIPTSATGTNWAGQDGKIGHYYGGAWTFYTAPEGLELTVNDTSRRARKLASGWTYSSLAGDQYDDGNSSTADTINWGLGSIHKSTMTGDCTYTFTAPDTAGVLYLQLVQDGTGSRNPTWPATVKWEGGAEPTWSTAAGSIDLIRFVFDGTNYLGTGYIGFA